MRGLREFAAGTTHRAGPAWRGEGEAKPSLLWACLRFPEVWRFGGFGDPLEPIHA